MTIINKQQYWTGISILLNNFHAINRKLFACIIQKVERIQKGLHHIIDGSNDQDEIVRDDMDTCLLQSQLLHMANGTDASEVQGFVVHLKCVPKKSDKSIEAMGILGK